METTAVSALPSGGVSSSLNNGIVLGGRSAGNAVFAVSNAGNPTPMTLAMALRTAGAIVGQLD